jgi:hypothetical protein
MRCLHPSRRLLRKLLRMRSRSPDSVFKQPGRHCEPPGRRKAPPDDRLREAIQLFARRTRKLDCFVAALLAMTARNTFSLAARSARGLPSTFLTLQSEGAGNAGRRCAHGKKHARSAPRSHRKHPASPRDGLRLTSRSPRRSGSFATVTYGHDRKLDTSVEMSGPHDLAVRSNIARLARRYVHRIPPRRP